MESGKYWIRRFGRVHGPFTQSQITGGLQAGKLSLADELGVQQDGPWRALEQIADKLSSQPRSSSEHVQPTQQISPPTLPAFPQSRSTDCVLRIRRNTGLLNIMRKTEVFLDNELIAKLDHNKTHEIRLTTGRHLVEVKRGDFLHGAKHNLLAVPSSHVELVVSCGVLGGLKTEEFISGGEDSPTDAGPPGSPAFILEGLQDVLEVYSEYLTITPKGLLGFLNKGLKGTKNMPYTSITAIQFREASSFLSGFIQFSMLGGNESRGGLLSATTDENTVMFARIENNEKVKRIKCFVDDALRKLHTSNAGGGLPQTLAEQIKKLAHLREQGLISEDEFLQAKQKLFAL